MERVPILKIGSTLFVSIQIDLQDETVMRLQEDLADELVATGARGVIIDITAVEIVDSFIGGPPAGDWASACPAPAGSSTNSS